jgi:hypothetical protein
MPDEPVKERRFSAASNPKKDVIPNRPKAVVRNLFFVDLPLDLPM